MTGRDAEKPGSPIRVLIVDDHPAVREGLVVRISSQADMMVCGQAADVADTLEILDAARPDVAVVDVQLKTGDGLDLVKRILARDGSVRILVWSMYPDKLYAKRAIKAGALGYINKEHTTGRIVEAIRCVRDGKIYLSDETANRLLSEAVSGPKSPRESPLEALSDRELEVFRLIGAGHSTAEVAARLRLSTHTIDTHRQRIKDKLGLANASELTQAAIRWALENGRPDEPRGPSLGG